MLGKLLKYEWKETYKMGILMLALVLIMTLVGAVGFAAPLSMLIEHDEVFAESAADTIRILTMVVSIILYIFTLLGVMYGTIIYLGLHFYRSMYSDEGYLTQTLPVTPHQLLLSKILVSGSWYLVMEIAIGFSVVALVVTMLAAISGSAGVEFSGMLPGEAIGEIFEEMTRVMDVNAAHYVISMLLAFLVTPFSTMIMLFGALTIGQLSRKYKGVMGIVAYFGIIVINIILANILQFFFTFGVMLGKRGNAWLSMTRSYDSSLLLMAGMGTALYFIAHHILSKKLNMA